MKTSKNLLAWSLMVTGLILLLALEFRWLKISYRSEHERFNWQTEFLFRNTVRSLQESRIRKSVVALPADSSISGGTKFLIHDPLQDEIPGKGKEPDSRRHSEDQDLIPVILFNENQPAVRFPIDSLLNFIRPVMAGLPPDHGPKQFLIDLSLDSINTDTLKNHYNAVLLKSGIRIHFTIQKKSDGRHRVKGSRNDQTTPFAGENPRQQYAAGFENIRIYLVGKILPQILFSVILSTLIVVSFYFMYRNQRTNRRLMELKNDFISNITHELKTPVATVSVALEALRKFKVLEDPGKTREYLDIASSELNRLNLMVDKILSTAVFEHKGLEFKNEPVDLRDMIRQVTDSMKLVYDKRKAKVNFKEEGEDFRVGGSTVNLMNVIYNLIDNALKYSQPGVTINITVKSDSRFVEFSIRDDGMGIAPEYHKRIFEKFGRVPGGDVHNSKGYGLGLSYVKEVVEGHHGTIDLVSQPGSGSTFTVRIPKSHE